MNLGAQLKRSFGPVGGKTANERETAVRLMEFLTSLPLGAIMTTREWLVKCKRRLGRLPHLDTAKFVYPSVCHGSPSFLL